MVRPEIDFAGQLVVSAQSYRWLSASGSPAPAHVVEVDDRVTANEALRLAKSGTGLLWRGDFHNARQLLNAVSRRVRSRRRPARTPVQEFRRQRHDQSRQARVLALVLVPIDPGHVVPLRRAPDVRHACQDVYGPLVTPGVLSLRELLGVISAAEWRRKGVWVPALGARIHPHYGVFAPTRSEYVDLVAAAPLPGTGLAFDIGTGTGVLAAVLARRGVERIVATDNVARAVRCAQDTMRRLGLAGRVEVLHTDLFPKGRADLVVCNPPWLPAEPHSLLDHAVYDPGGRMLGAFLAGVAQHLRPAGETWLVLSDLAERLGLRTRAELLDAIDRAGLTVLDRSDIRPRHPRIADSSDPLHSARASEITSLWRLAPGIGCHV
ncbi:class I SAM-dependent methyltransferase [Saccharopolyspora thermophila]|uniref:Class I SAM-dependent methyltransferase n=1 Tax=Saccharopolyspora thermophila TaxID=89367 RepID=A0ABN1DDQ8_9PSEU